jgi:hypothetical protein
VQTFLPYASFRRSAAVLDRTRLGKQRVEALQILRAQHVPGYGWRHHPAVKMWRDREEALACYGLEICREWIRRGHRDTVTGTLIEELGRAPRPQPELRRLGLLPRWLGNRAFHLAHRSSLVRKDPEHYRPFFPHVPDDLPSVWPEP